MYICSLIYILIFILNKTFEFYQKRVRKRMKNLKNYLKKKGKKIKFKKIIKKKKTSQDKYSQPVKNILIKLLRTEGERKV